MSQYLKYILRGFLTMLGAILAVVVVYFLVQTLLLKSDDGVTSIPIISDTNKNSDGAVAPDTSDTSASSAAEPAPGGIYLRDLPLTDAQVSMASTFGIDVETYYIAPETINCAENSLGADRYQAIVGGESPSFTEATKLLNCL